ncbi:MAG: cryptochrome/photolyase family protein [Acidimicrobiales bacterium]
MPPVVVLCNRDLRVHDHPALAEAARRTEQVVPLFVFDTAILSSGYASPNRVGFLLEALDDLRGSLRRRGADLVVRRGDPVAETMAVVERIGAGAIHFSADVSGFAQRREQDLAEACAAAGVGCERFPGVTVVPYDALHTTSGQTYRVFTPYWRAWSGAHRRPVEALPRPFRLPESVEPGDVPTSDELVPGGRSPDVARGGEAEARRLLNAWSRSSLADYDTAHDDLASDTSRISPYLHFGCVSALEVVTKLEKRAGAGSFVRQMCWRDFHHQFTYAFPAIAREDYRSRADDWSHDNGDLEAWKQGRTGYPIVDAGMRQLSREGWMHNRARLITASFLVKDLYVDWRLGARHFLDWLVDGDIANNSANWQWVAGTGADTRPNRVLNPLRQAERFDPEGSYVRRYVPELGTVAGKAVHQPWMLEANRRRGLDYPEPLVDHQQAVAAYRARHR